LTADITITHVRVQGERDYKNLPEGLPALKASLDTGHMGTFFDKQGGKFGKAAVAYFNWVMKGDQKAKAMFMDPQSDLKKDGWSIEHKNWT
jgi:hypothetical protein